ncbi:MAG: double zinc ribbon domain-containing protein [Treponema sp.]|jgi:predicted amidophosphoribosyltransferase|nr:double zinc ribbon domain-containing protein [Treponema sp.]
MKNHAPFLSLLGEVIFPEGCALCGKALYSAAEARWGLCKACRESLAARLSPEGLEKRCSLCGKPLISETGRCLACREGPEPSFDRIMPLFPYRGRYEKCLKAYKFGGRLKTGRFFAACLERGLEILSETIPDFPAGAAWVPVPPRPGKIKKEGWDQIEYLARLLGKKRASGERELPGPPGDPPPGLPVLRCLKRLPSRNQKELDRGERLRNLKGRIVCAGWPPGGRAPALPVEAVLLDDVFTTGATMNECARALKDAGVLRVYGVCLCYD